MCSLNFEILQLYPTEQTHVGAPAVALLRGAEDGVCWVVGEFIFGAQSLRKCVFVQLAVEHGAKSLRKCAEGIQKQLEGRRRARRGCPGGTQDRPKGTLEAPRTAKKSCWRHPGGGPGNGSVPETSKAISTSALYPFWNSILAPFLCRTNGVRGFFI